MSGDEKQDYFCDGISEEILNAPRTLAGAQGHWPHLFVLLQRQEHGLAHDRPGARRGASRRRQRPAPGQSGAHFGAARERQRRRRTVVAKFRPRPLRHFEGARRHRGHHRRQARRRRQRTRSSRAKPRAGDKRPGLRPLSRRRGPVAEGRPRKPGSRHQGARRVRRPRPQARPGVGNARERLWMAVPFRQDSDLRAIACARGGGETARPRT